MPYKRAHAVRSVVPHEDADNVPALRVGRAEDHDVALEAAPQGLNDVLTGASFGKVVVEVGPERA